MPAPKKRMTQRKARQNKRYKLTGRPKIIVTPKIIQRRASEELRRQKKQEKQGKKIILPAEKNPQAVISNVADALKEHGVAIEKTRFSNRDYLQLRFEDGRQKILSMDDPNQVTSQLKRELKIIKEKD